MKTATGRFLLRWFVCGLGLWIAAALLGSGNITYQNSLAAIVVSGLILAIINTVLKPILVILSLPAILFSLGLFMVVINGFSVWLVSTLYSPLHVENFWAAMGAGLVIGLVNWLVTTILDRQTSSD
jgi:putative membrane protein